MRTPYYRATLTGFIALALFIALPAIAAPSITVVSPTEGSTVDGPDVTVTTKTEDFTLTDYAKETTDKTDQGHLHIWLDEANPTASNAAMSVNGSYLFRDVTNGAHTLVVEAVDNTHDSLSPAAKKTVTFTTTVSPTTNGNVAATNAVSNTNTASTTTGTGTIVLIIVVILIVIAIIWYAASRGGPGETPKTPPSTPAAPPPPSNTPNPPPTGSQKM